MGHNTKKRKNNRNNKKNKIKKANKLKAAYNASTTEQKSPESASIEHTTQDEETEDQNEHLNDSKRTYEEDDSDDNQGKPKKKKKKPVVPQDTGDKKGQKSIRQMKREKHVQRMTEAQHAAKDQLKAQCLSYLSQWKHDRQNWKFMKAKQVWLYKNKFSKLIPNDSWPLLLEYFESSQGNIRNMLLEDANKIIKAMDEWTESQQNDTTESEDKSGDTLEISKPDDTTYKRARDLIQCLQ